VSLFLILDKEKSRPPGGVFGGLQTGGGPDTHHEGLGMNGSLTERHHAWRGEGKDIPLTVGKGEGKVTNIALKHVESRKKIGGEGT